MDKREITLEYLTHYAGELDRQLRELCAQMREITEKRDTVRKAVLLLQGAVSVPPANGVALDGGVGAPPAGPEENWEIGAAATMPPSVTLGDLAGVVVDFSNATNLLSRLRCVGRAAPGGILRVGATARKLIADGQSAAAFNNLRRSVDAEFREHPDLFEYRERGTYRYRDASP